MRSTGSGIIWCIQSHIGWFSHKSSMGSWQYYWQTTRGPRGETSLTIFYNELKHKAIKRCMDRKIMYKKPHTKRQKQVIVILECTDLHKVKWYEIVGEAMIIIYGGSDTYTHGDDNDIIERFENWIYFCFQSCWINK